MPFIVEKFYARVNLESYVKKTYDKAKFFKDRQKVRKLIGKSL